MTGSWALVGCESFASWCKRRPIPPDGMMAAGRGSRGVMSRSMSRLGPHWIAVGTMLLALGACTEESPESTDAADAQAPGDADGEPSVVKTDEVADKAPIDPPPLALEPPPTGHAVARIGALLFDSSTGEAGFELPPLSLGDGPPGVTVNVVGQKDDRLVVETLVSKPVEHHCAGQLPGLSDFRLRLYVAREDLLPVLTSDVVHAFADGTRVQLQRGVVVSGPGDAVAVDIKGTKVEIEIPEESVGRFYEPTTALLPTGEKGEIYPVDGLPLSYGSGRVLGENGLFGHRGTISYFDLTTKGTDALLTVRNACAQVTALASNERLSRPKVEAMARHFDPEKVAENAGLLGMLAADEGHFLASPYGSAFATGATDEDVWGGLSGTEVGEAFGVGGLGLAPATPTYKVKAGTAILWPDGNAAGQVVAEHEFAAAPRQQQGHSCFDVKLVGSSAPGASIVLCFMPADVAEIKPEPVAIGGLGLIGRGGGGASATGGAGFGGRGKRVPRVRQAKATVKGSLDKDIIRRIVRSHINEVRHCYNQGLAKDPSLEGRVSIQFTIGPTGKVVTSVVGTTTLGDKNVANCVAKAVKRWKFPRPPGGGNAIVSYPFVLSPG